LVCEVIAERFDPERVLQMANMELGEPPPPPPPIPPAGVPAGMAPQGASAPGGPAPPPPVDPAMQEYQQKAQTYQAAFQMLQDEKLRGFRIDIETDSTIQPDEDAEKQRATEFLAAFGGLIQQAMPIVGQAPELAPMVSELLLFTARRFRAGRMLEDSIEQSLQAVQQKITQMQAQQAAQPSPEQMQAQQAEKDGQAKRDADAQKANDEAVKAQRDHEMKLAQEATKKSQYDFEMAKHNDLKAQTERQFEADQTLRKEELGFQRSMKKNEAFGKVMGNQKPAQSPDDAEALEAGPFDQMMAALNQLAQIIGQVAQAQGQQNEAVLQGINELREIAAAPAVLDRDAQGRPVGAHKQLPNRTIN
jgi:hypothetical protein